MIRFRATSLALGAALLVANVAYANTEPGAMYDTRSTSMGGTGVAATTSGAAVYHNPAALDDVKRFTGTATFSPMINRVSAPWGLGQRDSTNALAPMPMLGVGLRLHERFTLGLGGFLLAGAGAKYEDVPELGGADAKMAALAGELQVPFALRIFKGLSIGAGYRLTYAHLSSELPMPVDPTDPTLGFVTPEVKMSGVNPLGVQIGVLAKPLPLLRLGVSYRSKVTVDLEGDATVPGMPTQDADGEFAVPHKFTAGAALSLLEVLVLAADVKYWMYSDSHEANADNGLPGDWRDAFSLNLGGEYLVLPVLPVRAGFFLGTQATTPEAANPFMPPPGLLYGITAGVGLRAKVVEVDVGGAYEFGSDEVAAADANPAAGVMPGEYAFRSIVFSASATVRL